MPDQLSSGYIQKQLNSYQPFLLTHTRLKSAVLCIILVLTWYRYYPVHTTIAKSYKYPFLHKFVLWVA